MNLLLAVRLFPAWSCTAATAPTRTRLRAVTSLRLAFESLILTFTVRPARMLKRLDPSLIRFATVLPGRLNLRTVLSVSLP